MAFLDRLRQTKAIAEWQQDASDLSRRGDHQRAEVVLGRALKQHPGDPSLLASRAFELFSINWLAEALECLDRALSARPREPELLKKKVVVLLTLGQHDQALKCVDQALTIDSSEAELWNNRGSVLDMTGRRDEALAYFER